MFESKKPKVPVKLVEDLGALGVNNMITAVSEFTIQVDITTLEKLIAMAQENQLSVPACMECGTAHEVMFYTDSEGKLVAYCFGCAPEGLGDY